MEQERLASRYVSYGRWCHGAYLARLLLHMCGGQKGERNIHSHERSVDDARVCDGRVSREEGRETGKCGKVQGNYRRGCLWVETEAGREGGRRERKGEPSDKREVALRSCGGPEDERSLGVLLAMR